MWGIANLFMLMVEKAKEKLESLDVTLFDEKEIKKILQKISTPSKDYLKEYLAGNIKCFACNSIIGPKSDKGKILGAILYNKEGIRFSCQDLKCYDEALE